jgi:EAL domain-containing protein (putative c-di-GMP-specific phosphodiesterase class I)
MHLTIVAEGVETEQVCRQLTELGCQTAQGYHIAKPLPAAELVAWLEARSAPPLAA